MHNSAIPKPILSICTWIVCCPSKCNPTATRNSGSVTLRRIDEIERQGVQQWVEISIALPHDIKIVTMEVEWMDIILQNSSVLKHKFNSFSEVEDYHFCRVPWSRICRYDTCVVVYIRWPTRKSKKNIPDGFIQEKRQKTTKCSMGCQTICCSLPPRIASC